MSSDHALFFKLVLALASLPLGGLVVDPVAPSLAKPEARSHAATRFDIEPDELELIRGSLLLAGEGALSSAARTAFVDLAGGGSASIAVLSDAKAAKDAIDWTAIGARDQTWVRVRRASDLTEEDTLTALLAADGIWLDSLSANVHGEPLLRSVLVNALDRGAAVGASGALAHALTGVPGIDTDRLCLAPRIELVFGVADVGNTGPHHKAAKKMPARIALALANGAAVALFAERYVDVSSIVRLLDWGGPRDGCRDLD